MLRTRRLPLSAAALVAALSLSACGSDDPETAKEPAAAASEAAAAPDPQAVADAANASYAVMIEETLTAIESGLADDAMDDFAAFVDEWYPQTSAWLAWDTFASVHAYAVLRTLVGVSMLSIGLVDDPAAEAEKLLAEDPVEAAWVSFDGDVASVADPDTAEGEDMLPIHLVERDGAWLIDGTVFDDAWFEEQGTTAEEALNS